MSVKIRLQRGGRHKLPVYSIVVADSHRSRDGKFIERLGYWAPKAKPTEQGLSLTEERLNHWISLGAQPSDVVIRLMVKLGVGPQKLRDDYAAKKQRRIKAEQAVKDFTAKREAGKAAKEAKANEAAEAAAAAEAKAAAEAAAAAEAKAAAEAQAAAAAEAPAAEEQPAA